MIGDVRDEAGEQLAGDCRAAGGRALFQHAEASSGEEEARKMAAKAQPIPMADDPADIAALAASLASDDAQ